MLSVKTNKRERRIKEVLETGNSVSMISDLADSNENQIVSTSIENVNFLNSHYYFDNQLDNQLDNQSHGVPMDDNH